MPGKGSLAFPNLARQRKVQLWSMLVVCVYIVCGKTTITGAFKQPEIGSSETPSNGRKSSQTQMFEIYHLELGLFAQRIVAWLVGEAVSCFVTTTLLSCRNSLQEILFASDVNFQQKIITKPHRSYSPTTIICYFPTTIDKLIALGVGACIPVSNKKCSFNDHESRFKKTCVSTMVMFHFHDRWTSNSSESMCQLSTRESKVKHLGT